MKIELLDLDGKSITYLFFEEKPKVFEVYDDKIIVLTKEVYDENITNDNNFNDINKLRY